MKHISPLPSGSLLLASVGLQISPDPFRTQGLFGFLFAKQIITLLPVPVDCILGSRDEGFCAEAGETVFPADEGIGLGLPLVSFFLSPKHQWRMAQLLHTDLSLVKPPDAQNEHAFFRHVSFCFLTYVLGSQYILLSARNFVHFALRAMQRAAALYLSLLA